jgi:hypothetical protein
MESLLASRQWGKLLTAAAEASPEAIQALREQLLQSVAVDCKDWADRLEVCLALSYRPWLRRQFSDEQPSQLMFVQSVKPVFKDGGLPYRITLVFWAIGDGQLFDDSETVGFAELAERTVERGLAYYGLSVTSLEDIRLNRKTAAAISERFSLVGTRCLCNGLAVATLSDEVRSSGPSQNPLECGDGRGMQIRLAGDEAVVDVLQEDRQTRQLLSVPLETIANWRNYRTPVAFGGLIDILVHYIQAVDAEKLREAISAMFPSVSYVPVMLLKRNRRAYVHVEHLSLLDAAGRGQMFAGLCLPSRTKSFLQQYAMLSRGDTVDLVATKSLSHCLLFTGPPGVGKTLSAEAIADYCDVPLYFVSCTNLGQAAEELQAKFELVAARAARWGAMVLLDDADLYVGSRLAARVQPEIVSQVLNFLERYNGWLFITTNMRTQVDDAIRSRCYEVQIDLPGVRVLKEIWSVLMKRNGLPIVAEDCQKLASTYPKLSGREVMKVIRLFKSFGVDNKNGWAAAAKELMPFVKAK